MSSGPGGGRGTGRSPGSRAQGAIAVAVVVVLVVACTAFVLPSADAGRSSLERGREGTAALADVLRARGTPVESLRIGLHALGRRPSGSVLLSLAASRALATPYTDQDVARVLDFADAGSTVVLFSDRPHPLAGAVGVEVEARGLGGRGGARAALPTMVHPLTLGGELELRGTSALSVEDAVPLFGVDRASVVALQPVGRGAIFVVADPFIVSNAGLGRAGNFDVVMAMIDHSLQPGGVVLFDDLHAGAPTAAGTLAYARRAGLGPALWVASITLALALWRAGRREGSVVAGAVGGDPLASSEMVHALGALYERAGVTDHALDVLSRRFRRRLEARSGGAWSRGEIRPWVLAELGPAATREFDDLSRRFAEAFRGGDPTLEHVHDLARRVHAFEERRLVPPAMRSLQR